MKEFEKYFNEKYPLPPTIERGPVGRDFKRGCGEAWKAALEWVVNECVLPNGMISHTLISKELNDE